MHALGLNSCFELAQNTSLTNYLFIRHLSVLIPPPLSTVLEAGGYAEAGERDAL